MLGRLCGSAVVVVRPPVRWSRNVEGVLVHGLIEGFYGPPWSWQAREEVCRRLGEVGMDTFVYAPKDDPLHRAEWRTPYGLDELAAFERLAHAQPLRVGFSVAPGLTMDPGHPEDRAALLAKFRQLVERGVSLLGVLFDDLDPAEGLGTAHGQVTAWLRERLPGDVELFMVPLHYTGTTTSPYLEELLEEIPEQVPIGWTGPHVVNDVITAQHAREWSAAMGGRRPLLWDNTPVNDAVMSHQLFTGPLRGRDPQLPELLSGYLANPMLQARASVPALVSAAAWWGGEDPVAAWQASLGPDRVLLEGCDGAVPEVLAAAALGGDRTALAELEDWFTEAEQVQVGSLGEEVRPWVDRLRAEAAVGRVACGVLRAEPEEAATIAPLLLIMWPLPAADHQVLGGRGSLVPALGQDDRSHWVAASACFRPGARLVDRLVQAAFTHLG